MNVGLIASRRRVSRAIAENGRVAFLLSTDAGAGLVEELRPILGCDFDVHRRGQHSDGIDLLIEERSPGEGQSSPLPAGVRVLTLTEVYAACTGRMPLSLVQPEDLENRLRGKTARWRVLDSAVGAALLVLSLPLQLLVGVAVAVEAGFPVLFSQQRLGRGKRPFTLLKFRTMTRDAEAEGPRWSTRDDPRVTRLGRLLRRCHLDELPQLWNLARGDLGLIGPRPIRETFARRLTAHEPLYEARFLHPPGVTGWSQVLGPYGATIDEHLVKLEMDLLYLAYGNRLDDLFILAKTVQVMLTGKGV